MPKRKCEKCKLFKPYMGGVGNCLEQPNSGGGYVLVQQNEECILGKEAESEKRRRKKTS